VKKFHFPLECALAWRRRQCEDEERRLECTLAALHAIEGRRRALAASRQEAQASIRGHTAPAVPELWSLSQYLSCALRQERVLEADRASQVRAVDAQRRRVLEARRRVRLLERLKEDRLAEWNRDFNRELENLAAEAYLTRWPHAP
jgi:hypothetical protein